MHTSIILCLALLPWRPWFVCLLLLAPDGRLPELCQKTITDLPSLKTVDLCAIPLIKQLDKCPYSIGNMKYVCNVLSMKILASDIKFHKSILMQKSQSLAKNCISVQPLAQWSYRSDRFTRPLQYSSYLIWQKDKHFRRKCTNDYTVVAH